MAGEAEKSDIADHLNRRNPVRIVSLVPSITESLFELGLGDRVVGVTDFCSHPESALTQMPRVGGPKNPDLISIKKLNPDLVIANQEENTPQIVNGLQDAGIQVWLTFPKTVTEAIQVLWNLARIDPQEQTIMRLRLLENSLQWAKEAADLQTGLRFFCPIWKEVTAEGIDWWMTFNQDTYAHDLLTTLGGVNVFAGRDRRYPLQADLGEAPAQNPGDRDIRYPRVTIEEIQAVNPEIILLPDEPFSFEGTHLDEFNKLLPDCAAVTKGQVHLVEGSLITWHGTRIGRALNLLPQYFVRESSEQL